MTPLFPRPVGAALAAICVLVLAGCSSLARYNPGAVSGKATLEMTKGMRDSFGKATKPFDLSDSARILVIDNSEVLAPASFHDQIPISAGIHRIGVALRDSCDNTTVYFFAAKIAPDTAHEIRLLSDKGHLKVTVVNLITNEEQKFDFIIN